MKNYLMYNGNKYEIDEENAKNIIKASTEKGTKKLADISVGDTFKIADMEFVVLENLEGKTAVILKDALHETVQFGNNNNYDGSNVDKLCLKFAEKIATIIGEENLIEHEVDLTAANGMKCYGVVTRKCSLLTLDRVRHYCNILCENSTSKWEWLATSNGTPKWGNDAWVVCVSPGGCFGDDNSGCGNHGVRPFCIFDSNIFVS